MQIIYFCNQCTFIWQEQSSHNADGISERDNISSRESSTTLYTEPTIIYITNYNLYISFVPEWNSKSDSAFCDGSGGDKYSGWVEKYLTSVASIPPTCISCQRQTDCVYCTLHIENTNTQVTPRLIEFLLHVGIAGDRQITRCLRKNYSFTRCLRENYIQSWAYSNEWESLNWTRRLCSALVSTFLCYPRTVSDSISTLSLSLENSLVIPLSQLLHFPVRVKNVNVDVYFTPLPGRFKRVTMKIT